MSHPLRISDEIRSKIDELPLEKQVEVYDFVEFLRHRTSGAIEQRTSQQDSMVGVIEGPADLASGHDEIYA